MLLILTCLLMPLTALLAGCDDNDQTSSNIHAAPDGVATGYDPRAAPGTQAPDGNRQNLNDNDAARPAAATLPADQQESPQGTRQLSDVDRAFLLDAVRRNAAQLKLAKLAHAKASRDDVKAYAKTILDEHLKLNQQLMAHATRQNVDLKEQRGNETDDVAEQMKDQSGDAFDRAYVQHEIKAHEQAVQKYRDAAGQVKDPEVLSLINQALPALERHLDAARQLAR
jgi:putative membrane protein